jgi:hypothetical protein
MNVLMLVRRRVDRTNLAQLGPRWKPLDLLEEYILASITYLDLSLLTLFICEKKIKIKEHI